MGGNASSEIEVGKLTLDLGSIVTSATARHDATETLVGGGPTTVVHDQAIFNSETRLIADLGVSPWLAVGLIVPVRVFHTTIQYLGPDGKPVAIENPFVHHHNETLVGPGDPWVSARVWRSARGFLLGARAGITIPLGRTEEDPFVLGDMGLPHEHSQFGTGTIEPIVGLDVARVIGRVTIDASALTLQSLYANKHGYQAGDRYAGALGVALPIGRSWRVRALGEAQAETEERWHGIVHTDEGNTGRVDVLAGAEVTWLANEEWHVTASLRLPLYTHVNGGQIDATAYAGLSVGTHVHLFEERPRAHAHAAGPPADWSGLDKQDLPGDVATLVPVPGKVTVFDFWATWCKPCGELDHALEELARRHPDDIAVRKIDIVDADSPASQRFLGAATIPHVKVYGRDGKLLFEKSAPPLVLAGEIEALVAPQRAAPVVSADARRIAIDVTEAGYTPARVEVKAGEPVVLVLTRRIENTCATDIHMTLPDGTHIDRDLPMNTAVEIPLQIDRPGEVSYACGMNMFHGTIVVH